MKKRLLAILIALVMIVGMLPAVTLAEETHIHDGINFTAWTSSTSLPSTAGSYYLTKDVTLSSAWTNLPSGNVNLCLNGHVIKRSGSGKVIKISNSRNLNIYDCNTTTEHYFKVEDSGLWSLLGEYEDGCKTVTGGCITGGQVTGSTTNGGGIEIEKGTVFLHGGSIVGNQCKNTSTGQALGGGIYVKDGTFTMTGGCICGNIATAKNADAGNGRGGGIWIAASTGNAFIYGGTISDNTVSLYGGGVYVEGNLTVGGTAVIRGNHSTYAEYVQNGDKENNVMNSGEILIAGEGYTPKNGMNIGVRRRDIANAVCTYVEDYSRYFSSDNAGLFVWYDADNKMIMLGNREGMFSVDIIRSEHGNIYTDQQAVEKGGATITLTVTPAEGYQLKAGSLKATYNDGTEKTLTPEATATEGQYIFTMPEANVVVTGEFTIPSVQVQVEVGEVTTTFVTLAEALNFANAQTVPARVTLLADIDEQGYFSVADYVTLDLDGNALSVKSLAVFGTLTDSKKPEGSITTSAGKKLIYNKDEATFSGSIMPVKDDSNKFHLYDAQVNSKFKFTATTPKKAEAWLYLPDDIFTANKGVLLGNATLQLGAYFTTDIILDDADGDVPTEQVEANDDSKTFTLSCAFSEAVLNTYKAQDAYNKKVPKFTWTSINNVTSMTEQPFIRSTLTGTEYRGETDIITETN